MRDIRVIETGNQHRPHFSGHTRPLLAIPGTSQVGKNFFLDEKCQVRGFVSVAPTSLAWKDKVGRYEVNLTQGLVVSLDAQYSWTIPSRAWTHLRTLFRGEPEDLLRVFHNERLRQEALEKTGHSSPKWTVLRSLHQLYGARKIRGCTIIDVLRSLSQQEERSQWI
jgi:hypothetical protein